MLLCLDNNIKMHFFSFSFWLSLSLSHKSAQYFRLFFFLKKLEIINNRQKILLGFHINEKKNKLQLKTERGIKRESMIERKQQQRERRKNKNMRIRINMYKIRSIAARVRVNTVV